MSEAEKSGYERRNRAIWAPNDFVHDEKYPKSVFLAGYIGRDHPTWQESLIESLKDLPITVLNPYRSDWNWPEDIENKDFSQQTNWELDMMKRADVIAMCFSPDPEVLAPISLLELGLHAATGKMVVVCPKGYWKRGNVQVVCQRFGIEVLDSVQELEEGVRKRLESLGTNESEITSDSK